LSNTHRIRWIDQQIRNKEYPNCKIIADHFELSLRQASRDIEYLRYSLEAPLVYNHDHQGYEYQHEAFSLPSLFISQEDRDAIYFVARYYQQANSTQAQRIADLLLKISGESTESSSYNVSLPGLSLNQSLISRYRQVDRAIQTHHKIQIKYHSESKEVTVRIVHPYEWYQVQTNYYLVGYCEKRQDIRFFRLDRIRRLIPLNETFQILPSFQSGKIKPFQLPPLRKPFHAVVQWKKSVILPDDFSHKFKQMESFRFDIEFYQSSDLFSSLIQLNIPFTILEPDWLNEQLVRFLDQFYPK